MKKNLKNINKQDEIIKIPLIKAKLTKTCNFTKKKSTNDDLKEQFFLKSKREKKKS